jgi:FKBP-type peptidyl-prolyl cis-trans isomerase
VVFSLKKTLAPTTEKSIDVQSQVNKMTKGNAAGSQTAPSSSATVNNNNNKQPMQLEIKTTQAGTGDRVVKAGDTIGVYYTGKLTDGTTFDSNAGSGKPFEFTVGAGMVIQGWEQGFMGAKVGEKRTLTIPATLGYGAAGAGGAIPPNATLIFDVELVSIK